MTTIAEIQTLEAEVAEARAQLARRWNSFERELGDIAQSASEEVSHTVQQAKDAVSIPHHVERRPWSMVGGAVLAGVALSRFAGAQGMVGLGLATALTKALIPDGPDSPIRSKAVSSLTDMARQFVHRKVPPAFAPMVEQAIVRAAENFSPQAVKVGKAKRSINEKGESILV